MAINALKKIRTNILKIGMVSAKDLGFCSKYAYRLGVAIFSIHFSFIYNYIGNVIVISVLAQYNS